MLMKVRGECNRGREGHVHACVWVTRSHVHAKIRGVFWVWERAEPGMPGAEA